VQILDEKRQLCVFELPFGA